MQGSTGLPEAAKITRYFTAAVYVTTNRARGSAYMPVTVYIRRKTAKMAYALITGASKGIGKSLALELAKRKYNLVLTARSAQLLQQLATEIKQQYEVEVKTLALDLAEPAAAAELEGYITAQNIPLTVLVNNAGYGLWGRFTDLKLEDQLNMLHLNVESLIGLSHRLLPHLHKQPRAYVLNVASTAAYQAVPYMSLYAASKSLVVSFSRGLATELNGSGISVTCLSPGATGTNFMERAGMTNNKRLLKASARFEMTADEVAVIAVNALFAGKVEVVPGLVNKVQIYANNFLPKQLVERMAVNIFKAD